MKNSIFPVLAASALAFSLAACGSDDGGSDAGSGGEASGDAAAADLDLITDGTLTVCSDVPYPPFEDFDDSSDSGFTGFDVDIVSAVADGLGLELEIKDSSFETLQSGLALNSGDCDLAASAMTITEDRQKSLAFSDGYYDSKQSLLVPAGSDITGIGDLAGRTVGVQQGTTGESYTEENAPEATITAFPSNAEMFQAIQAGQVDALLQDLPVNVDNSTKGDFEVVEEYDTDETYGLAMQQDNTALVDAVNEQLTALRDSGEYDELYDTYFTTEGAEDSSATSEG
ncbi:Glutamine ABC transporter, periplasmic glutamine-binding protein [Serinicoccus hydrothermalis]|uniref:Glutamine ABC transporter, periplasmic glutamine-binding protein n=1 Tax=Serinicoccus hydrothermalis TaxID=1758689 RepID=A0A1B1N7L0_9MICO|nr:transporter substrate-binding domain-containing protein [Serinicoccus hydrothermalis]ANS77398.1 Glutamine ABC transporter, periplasmic glutamine-binding protein [Serinicoccus hydrothermalis]